MALTQLEEEAIVRISVYLEQLAELQSYGVKLKTSCTRLREADAVLQAVDVDALMKRIRYLRYSKKRLPPQSRCPELDALLRLEQPDATLPITQTPIMTPSNNTARQQKTVKKSQTNTLVATQTTIKTHTYTEEQLRRSAAALNFTDRQIELVLHGTSRPTTPEQRVELGDLRKRIREYLENNDAHLAM